MKVTKSNKDLLLAMKEGDMVAFYHIYERYCKRLYGFVLRYIKQKQDAEGIVQEVFIKIWESRGKINVCSSFESFIFTIAYNATITLFRKRTKEKKYLEHLKSLQQIEKAPDLEDEVHYNELNEQVQKLLDKLTPRQKEIFRLSRQEDLTHEEIAQKLDITVNTVKKHMVNTLAFLKSHLNTSLINNLLFIYLFL